MEDPFVHHDRITREAFGLPDQRGQELKPDGSCQVVYYEHRLAPVAVKYKAGIRCYTFDDVITYAYCAPGRDNCVLLWAGVELAAVIDELASDRGEDGDEGDWDLPTADVPVPDICCNE